MIKVQAVSDLYSKFTPVSEVNSNKINDVADLRGDDDGLLEIVELIESQRILKNHVGLSVLELSLFGQLAHLTRCQDQ